MMLKFMAWFSAFVTIGFIVLMVFDYGNKAGELLSEIHEGHALFNQSVFHFSH